MALIFAYETGFKNWQVWESLITTNATAGFCLVGLLSVVDLGVDPYKSTGVDLGSKDKPGQIYFALLSHHRILKEKELSKFFLLQIDFN